MPCGFIKWRRKVKTEIPGKFYFIQVLALFIWFSVYTSIVKFVTYETRDELQQNIRQIKVILSQNRMSTYRAGKSHVPQK